MFLHKKNQIKRISEWGAYGNDLRFNEKAAIMCVYRFCLRIHASRQVKLEHMINCRIKQEDSHLSKATQYVTLQAAIPFCITH